MLREVCLVCDSRELRQIIDLGSHPFADTFIPESKVGEADAVYPLVCDLCMHCGHVQTKFSTNPNERYAQVDYSYTSANSSFSRNHWDEYKKEICAQVSLPKGALVVEVGSNDGYLTEQFIKEGYRAVGVDPSPYMANLAKERKVETIVCLFGKEVAENILNSYGKADLIIANNVYNHADNPVEFTKAVASLLSPNGCFVFEQPYWLISLKSGKFDQIYHEHVSYFTVKSAEALLARAGMEIKSASSINYHGGSLRIIAQKKGIAKKESEEALNMIKEEEKYGTFKPETYNEFMKSNLKQRDIFLQKLYKIREEGHPIIAVGAAAKGNTFLNFYHLGRTVLEYVTDSSPHKKGKYTPATRILIVGDEIFGKYSKVYALILSWNIAHQLKPILYKINPNIEFISPESQ